MSTLIWFQRDLRMQDNAALRHAISCDKKVVAVYIHSPQEDAPWSEGAASRWWLHQSLAKLHQDLQKINIDLQYFRGNSRELIPEIARFYNATSVHWTSRHEPLRRAIEQDIEKQLKQDGTNVDIHRDELLTWPDQFLTRTAESPYRVFTPFYKRLRSELRLEAKTPLSTSPIKSLSPAGRHTKTQTLDQLRLLDDHPWHEKLHGHWLPGESAAINKLHNFVENAMACYPTDRDYPAINGTSGLSPHLHFGEISPAQVLDVLTPLIEFGEARSSKAAEAFLRQLIWREFARYILLHFPETTDAPMNKKYIASFWQSDSNGLQKWQQGDTGIPIIDAGMKQLWESGTMHNRVRILVASLLTKNMGIHWLEGARWFWDTLVDADLANNTMGWQWVAGCGVDAAPYFRIFNPDTQTKRFDAKLEYIRRWTGPDEAALVQPTIVNLATSRQQALDRYNEIIR